MSLQNQATSLIFINMMLISSPQVVPTLIKYSKLKGQFRIPNPSIS